MDRTSKIIVAVCFLLIISWGSLTKLIWPDKPVPPKPQHATNAVSQASAPAKPSAAVSGQAVPVVSQLLNGPVKNFETAVLENDDVIVHFSGQGGGLKKIEFKRYDVKDEPTAAINEQSPTSAFDLEIPGEVYLGDEYKVSIEPGKKVVARRETEKLSITKTYTLGEGYQLQAEIDIVNKSKESVPAQPASPVLAAGTANPLTQLDTGAALGFCWYTIGDKYATGTLGTVSKKPFYKEATAQWIAVHNQFFALIVMPKEFNLTAIRAEMVTLTQSNLPYARSDQKAILVLADLPQVQVAAGESKKLNFDAYLGPRDFHRLQALGNGQERVMDYGIWAFFCKILLWLMIWFHGWMGNWGLAIIAMTIVIKGVFWPLTNVSTRSMKRMQALGPKMKEVQEKYKDDREKLGLETMKLYREYGVNPLGGCLPMVVQIPIFFALFSMLRSMVQLRGADFLWIHDLSTPDTVARIPFPEFQFLWWHMGPIPINPMPLIMVVAQIWQMRIMPATTTNDPSQKMMMWMMPFFFLLICYNFASALALYWTVQTLLQALQTYWVKNKPDEPLQKIKRPKSQGLTFGRPLEEKKKK